MLNKYNKIQTRNYLINKAMIIYKKIISIQKLKLKYKVLKYKLYYS